MNKLQQGPWHDCYYTFDSFYLLFLFLSILRKSLECSSRNVAKHVCWDQPLIEQRQVNLKQKRQVQKEKRAMLVAP